MEENAIQNKKPFKNVYFALLILIILFYGASQPYSDQIVATQQYALD